MPVRIMDPKKLFQRLKDTGFTDIQAEAVLGVLREDLEMEPPGNRARSEAAVFARSGR